LYEQTTRFTGLYIRFVDRRGARGEVRDFWWYDVWRSVKVEFDPAHVII